MVNVAVFERMPHAGLPDARWAYLANLWVEPDRRRRGVASALVTAAVDWARPRGWSGWCSTPARCRAALPGVAGFRPRTTCCAWTSEASGPASGAHVRVSALHRSPL